MKKQNKKDKLKNSQKETDELKNLDKELEDLINTNETLNVSMKKLFNDLSKRKPNNKTK